MLHPIILEQTLLNVLFAVLAFDNASHYLIEVFVTLVKIIGINLASAIIEA